MLFREWATKEWAQTTLNKGGCLGHRWSLLSRDQSLRCGMICFIARASEFSECEVWKCTNAQIERVQNSEWGPVGPHSFTKIVSFFHFLFKAWVPQGPLWWVVISRENTMVSLASSTTGPPWKPSGRSNRFEILHVSTYVQAWPHKHFPRGPIVYPLGGP